MRALLRYQESLIVAAYFVFRPVELLLWTETTARTIVIYGVFAPAVGVLLSMRHPRARFAAYIFLTMELVRAIAGESLVRAAVAVGVLLLLQLPRMRALWPRIDARRVAARLSRRA
jgi:hypothetical protein